MFVDSLLAVAPLDATVRARIAILTRPLDLVLMIAMGITFLRWMHLAYVATGPSSEFGSGAWGWFFAPVFALWKPYQAITTLYGLRAGMRPTPAIFPTWWGLFLLRGILGGVLSVVAGQIGLALSGLFEVIAALLAIRVIAEIDKPSVETEEWERSSL
jgi:hypothetical protein